MVDSISQSGLNGIKRGLQSLSKHAEAISKSFVNGEDPTGEIVGAKVDEHQIKASAKMIKVSESLDKAVLDILA